MENLISFNYRISKSVISSRTGINGSTVNFKNKYQYIFVEGKLISETKNYLRIERLVDGNLVRQNWNKKNISNINK